MFFNILYICIYAAKRYRYNHTKQTMFFLSFFNSGTEELRSSEFDSLRPVCLALPLFSRMSWNMCRPSFKVEQLIHICIDPWLCSSISWVSIYLISCYLFCARDLLSDLPLSAQVPATNSELQEFQLNFPFLCNSPYLHLYCQMYIPKWKGQTCTRNKCQ